jgi:RimJ/RimL family protein N-acetyltransferase
LFASDTNAFVDERFKTPGELRQYVQYQLEYAWYSNRRGGCDWFFLKDGRPAGVLHLYDLSHDETAGRHRRCTIGFATSAPFRRQGLTREATAHLLTHLFDVFGMEQVWSYTRRENTAAIGLLESLRFENRDTLFGGEEKELVYRYFVISRDRHVGR